MLQINKKYLPSRKFIVSLAIAICIVILTILLSYIRTNVTKYDSRSNLTLTASSSVLYIDTDGDTIPDWKERLYGTDPEKSDTDGDGTPDNIEIEQGRDPLKANTALEGGEPTDKISPEIIEKNNQILDQYNKLNYTDKMARNLMSNILASQPSNGQQIDSDTINYIASNSINDIPKKEYVGITTVDDLNLPKDGNYNFSSIDLEAYKKAYYNETVYFNKFVTEDLVLLNSYISTGKDVKKEMSVIISKYQRIINNLIKTPVRSAPNTNFVNFHLLLINYFEVLIKIDNSIINTDIKDVANIYADLVAYNDTIENLLMSIKALDIIFNIQR